MRKLIFTVTSALDILGASLTQTEVLEIEKGASKIEIKKAYHKVRRQRQYNRDLITDTHRPR
jgi:hypothetical protein